MIALDLVGFGHSAPEGRPTTVQANRDVLRRGYGWSDAAFLAAERSIMQALTVGRRRYFRF